MQRQTLLLGEYQFLIQHIPQIFFHDYLCLQNEVLVLALSIQQSNGKPNDVSEEIIKEKEDAPDSLGDEDNKISVYL